MAYFNGRDDPAISGIALPGRSDTGAIVLITGGRRAGKSTLLLALRQAALSAGWTIGGMLSIARFEGGEKVGIDVMDAATGQTQALATVSPQPGGPIHTGQYTFDADGLAAGLRYAQAGCAADLFIVDELGPLELVRGEGWAPALPLLRGRLFGAALVVVRPTLVAEARAALHLPDDAPLIEITLANRARWLARLSGWIAQRSPD